METKDNAPKKSATPTGKSNQPQATKAPAQSAPVTPPQVDEAVQKVLTIQQQLEEATAKTQHRMQLVKNREFFIKKQTALRETMKDAEQDNTKFETERVKVVFYLQNSDYNNRDKETVSVNHPEICLALMQLLDEKINLSVATIEQELLQP